MLMKFAERSRSLPPSSMTDCVRLLLLGFVGLGFVGYGREIRKPALPGALSTRDDRAVALGARHAATSPRLGIKLLATLGVAAASMTAAAQQGERAGKFYQIIGGKVDARTYNGFRRYNAVCSHCHGPDGMGSTFGPSLIDKLPDIDAFRRIVREGRSNGASVMKGFAGDPNVEPYTDDVYAYLQARADGALDRGRPVRMGD